MSCSAHLREAMAQLDQAIDEIGHRHDLNWIAQTIRAARIATEAAHGAYLQACPVNVLPPCSTCKGLGTIGDPESTAVCPSCHGEKVQRASA